MKEEMREILQGLSETINLLSKYIKRLEKENKEINQKIHIWNKIIERNNFYITNYKKEIKDLKLMRRDIDIPGSVINYTERIISWKQLIHERRLENEGLTDKISQKEAKIKKNRSEIQRSESSIEIINHF